MLFTAAVLEGIAAGRVTLAFRRWRRPTVKAGVRKLKELGLTESLAVGYRLSPRGAALLAAEDAAQ